MKFASTIIKASALSLILFAGTACAQSSNIESSKNLTKLEPQVQQVSDSVIAANVNAVDSNKIAGLGICASAGYMVEAAAEDSRIKSLVTVAPWIHNPAKRVGKPGEVADLVMWLASNDASYVSGG